MKTSTLRRLEVSGGHGFQTTDTTIQCVLTHHLFNNIFLWIQLTEMRLYLGTELQFENYENLLNLSILAAKHETSSGNLPVMLLSDIFDCRH